MAKITTCKWRTHWEDEPSVSSLYEIWGTSCDRKFEFMGDGPAENNYQFCPGCGRPIETPL